MELPFAEWIEYYWNSFIILHDPLFSALALTTTTGFHMIN
jgi:hypothetical protein